MSKDFIEAAREPRPPPGAARANELGYTPMDKVHAEFDELLQRARSVQFPEDWRELLRAIDTHLRAHFEAEDGWMRDTAFPVRECHMDEHAAVLKSSEEVLALAELGDVRAAPAFVDELASWFPGHADYLDSALAAWMCKRKFGGRPVVLHRKRDDAAAD